MHVLMWRLLHDYMTFDRKDESIIPIIFQIVDYYFMKKITK